MDGELLARFGQRMKSYCIPSKPREQSQADLELLKARDQRVAVRRKPINPICGAVKSMGGRLKNCGTGSFHQAVKGEIPEPIARAVEPLLGRLKSSPSKSGIIVGRSRSCVVKNIRDGSLAAGQWGGRCDESVFFVLIVDDAGRFASSRQVGCFVGLRPGKSQSGEQDRTAHHPGGQSFFKAAVWCTVADILGPYCKDLQLRRWGLKLAGEGGKIKSEP